MLTLSAPAHRLVRRYGAPLALEAQDEVQAGQGKALAGRYAEAGVVDLLDADLEGLAPLLRAEHPPLLEVRGTPEGRQLSERAALRAGSEAGGEVDRL